MITSRRRVVRHIVTASGAALCATLTASAAPAGAVVTTPAVQAHRGVHSGSYAGTPENSLYAYQAADNLGISRWETDVRFTSDGVPYQMHDASLDRTTTCTGPLEARNSSAFRNGTCLYKDGSKIESLYPTLQLLNLANARLAIEVKTVPTDAQAKALHDRLVLSHTLDQVELTSFDRNTHAILRKWFPNNKRVFLTMTVVSGVTVKRAGASAVGINWKVLTANQVLSYHNQGLQVLAWTPNDATAWASLKKMGVDVISTDEPEAYIVWSRPALRR